MSLASLSTILHHGPQPDPYNGKLHHSSSTHSDGTSTTFDTQHSLWHTLRQFAHQLPHPPSLLSYRPQQAHLSLRTATHTSLTYPHTHSAQLAHLPPTTHLTSASLRRTTLLAPTLILPSLTPSRTRHRDHTHCPRIDCSIHDMVVVYQVRGAPIL